MKTKKALRECAEWLSYCLSTGWKQSDLDMLERLWWRWHDDDGKLSKEAIDRELARLLP